MGSSGTGVPRDGADPTDPARDEETNLPDQQAGMAFHEVQARPR